MPKLGQGHIDEEDKGPQLHQIHPESRKARQMHRKKARRQEKRYRKYSTTKRSFALMEVCAWARLRVIEEEDDYRKAHDGKARTAFTELEATRLYSKYFDGLVEEAERLPPNTTNTMKLEEFKRLRNTWRTVGIRLPDLTSPRALRSLKAWEGNPAHLGADLAHDSNAVEFKLFRPPSTDSSS